MGRRAAAIVAACALGIGAGPASAWDEGPVPLPVPADPAPVTPAPAPDPAPAPRPDPPPAVPGLDLAALAPAAQREVAAAVRSYPARMRRMLAAVRPRVPVDASGRCAPSSCVRQVGGRPRALSLTAEHMADARVLRYILAHELGHVVDLTGLGARARTTFVRLAVARGVPACLPYAGGCVSQEDVLADSIAFWATGDLAMRSVYDVPPVVSRAEMGRFLARWWRPG
jgi:hypothetical protein